MRILVTWGTKRGGTEGIARVIAETLEQRGFQVSAAPAPAVHDVSAHDAAVIGGALYSNRWHRDARRIVARNVAALRRMPVWLFSSGPLDDSADREEIAPPAQVAALMKRIGACGHRTFGGRLTPDARGFPAAAMAKTQSGDWRNPERIRAWANELALALPSARPGMAEEPAARSPRRLLAHAVVGWALCAALMGGLLQITSSAVATVLHTIAVPGIFTAVSLHYFSPRDARDPLPAALAFTAVVALLDLGVVAGLILRSLSIFTSFAGTWLPLILIFLATWITGSIVSMMPASLPPLVRAANRGTRS